MLTLNVGRGGRALVRRPAGDRRAASQVGQLIAFINYLMQTLMSLMVDQHVGGARVARRGVGASASRRCSHQQPEIRAAPMRSTTIRAARADRVRECQLRLRWPTSDDPVLKGVSFVARAGADGRDAGRDRLGQVQPGQPDPALLRRHRRSRHARRRGRARDRRGGAAPRRSASRCRRRSCSAARSATTSAMAGPEATDDEVIAAARMAQAHDFISRFPDGYDSIVGQRGVNLSGGQKQRIAIARALLYQPGGADPRRQHQRGRRGDRGAHPGGARERTARRRAWSSRSASARVLGADRILVLDDGRIAAQGTHAELLESSPIYREIYDSQMQHGATQSWHSVAQRATKNPEPDMPPLLGRGPGGPGQRFMRRSRARQKHARHGVAPVGLPAAAARRADR